jgi:protein-S-isoprenylcysteine O-methyltransferase Ste14
MPTRYKNILLAALVIAFGFGMSELMKFLTTTFNIPSFISFLFTTILGLVIIYVVAKKLHLGEENNDPPDDHF